MRLLENLRDYARSYVRPDSRDSNLAPSHRCTVVGYIGHGSPAAGVWINNGEV